MAKKAKVKETVKKTVTEKVKEVLKPKDETKSLIAKRQMLIDEIIPKLLTNAQLKRGDSAIRGKHLQEQYQWNPVIAEINELGKQLGFRMIGLGSLRK